MSQSVGFGVMHNGVYLVVVHKRPDGCYRTEDGRWWCKMCRASQILTREELKAGCCAYCFKPSEDDD